MAAVISLSCPKCQMQITAPAAARGKRVKCKACGEVFPVEEPKAPAKPAPAKGKPAPAKAPPKKAAPAKGPHADLDDDGNPYGVTNLDLTPRCPHW